MMMWEYESPSSLKSPLLGPNIPRRRLGHWLYQILGPAMGKHPALLYLSIALSAVGGFLFGYDTGVIAGAMPLIERDVIFWGEKGSGGYFSDFLPEINRTTQMRQPCGSPWSPA